MFWETRILLCIVLSAINVFEKWHCDSIVLIYTHNGMYVFYRLRMLTIKTILLKWWYKIVRITFLSFISRRRTSSSNENKQKKKTFFWPTFFFFVGTVFRYAFEYTLHFKYKYHKNIPQISLRFKFHSKKNSTVFRCLPVAIIQIWMNCVFIHSKNVYFPVERVIPMFF